MVTALGGASIYLLLMWRWRPRGRSPRNSRNAAFWGAIFAALWVFALPALWWRYGLRNTFWLVAASLGGPAIAVLVVKQSGLFDLDKGDMFLPSLILGLFGRALGGLWLAWNDERWREKIVSKRLQKEIAK